MAIHRSLSFSVPIILDLTQPKSVLYFSKATMKLSLTLPFLLVAAVQAGFAPSNPHRVTKTAVASSVGWGQFDTKKQELPPLDGLGKKYKAKDGSTILGPSFKLSFSIAAMAPFILACNPPGA